MAALAGLASLEERFQGEKGGWGRREAGRERGARGTCCSGSWWQPSTKATSSRDQKMLGGGKWKVERARLFTAMSRGGFLQPGQPRGTGITGRENESLLRSLRLIQALTWLPEPALPQPSRAGEGRMASVGKVRLLKQKAEEGRKGQWRSWIISIIAEAGEREVR